MFAVCLKLHPSWRFDYSALVTLHRKKILGGSWPHESFGGIKIRHCVGQLLLLLLQRLEVLLEVVVVLVDQGRLQASFGKYLQKYDVLADVVFVDIAHQPVEFLRGERAGEVDLGVRQERLDDSLSVDVEHVPRDVLEQLHLHKVPEHLHECIGALLHPRHQLTTHVVELHSFVVFDEGTQHP